MIIGRRTSNAWFAYSSPKDRKDIGPPPLPLSDEELADYERLPRDYDKEVHDNLYHTYICHCQSFVVVHIPNQDPLRLALVYRYNPRRLQTPYFIDAWEDNDNEDARELVLVHLDKYANHIKKCAVWRPQPLPLDDDNAIEPQASSTSTSKIRWSTTNAKSGMFEEGDDTVDESDDTVDEDSDGEDFADNEDDSTDF